MNHAHMSVAESHASYVKGCRCTSCRKGHAAYQLENRRSRERNRTDAVSGAHSHQEPQQSLLGPELQPRDFNAAAAVDTRSNGEPAEAELRAAARSLRTPTSPSAGKHHANASGPELKAALKIAPKSGTQRGVILLLIAEAEWPGIGQWELIERSGFLRSSVSGRCNELEEHGWIEKSGREHKTPMGSDENLYVATARGKRWVASQEQVSA